MLVLALGIGANAAVFSLINGLLLRPLAGSERPQPGSVAMTVYGGRASPG